MSLPLRFKATLLIALCGCAALSAAGTVRAHIVDSSGRPLTNAVVALYGASVPTFTDVATAVMDQRNKQFAPHVLAVRKNTLVSFPNSDDIRHHVYSFSAAKRFELRLYHGTPSQPVLFDTPGEVVLGCNIHDSMVGYIVVVDSPWFATSDKDGNAAIASVPAGGYRARVWLPGLAADAKGLEQTIEVANSDTNIGFQIAVTSTSSSDVAPASDLQMLFKRSGDAR